MDLILVSVHTGRTEVTLYLANCFTRHVTFTSNWRHLNKTSASPDSHALLDVCWGHLVAQVHHKLGKLFDVDNVFGVLRVCVDDLCASV